MKKNYIHARMKVKTVDLDSTLLTTSEGIQAGRGTYGYDDWGTTTGSVNGGRDDYSNGLWSSDESNSGVTSGRQDYGASSW